MQKATDSDRTWVIMALLLERLSPSRWNRRGSSITKINRKKQLKSLQLIPHFLGWLGISLKNESIERSSLSLYTYSICCRSLINLHYLPTSQTDVIMVNKYWLINCLHKSGQRQTRTHFKVYLPLLFSVFVCLFVCLACLLCKLQLILFALDTHWSPAWTCITDDCWINLD